MTAAALAAMLAGWLTIWTTPAGDPVLVKHWRDRADPAAELLTLAHDFRDAAIEADVPVELVAAVAFVESGLNPHAIGATGEGSVMQLNRRNAENRTALSQGSRAAIFRGASILAREFVRCGGTWTDALNAYHTGNCSPAPTRYVRRIFARMDAL